MKTLAILGAGHLGQQLAHIALSDSHYDRVFFYDDFTEEESINGITVKGKSNDLISHFSKKLYDELLIGIGYNHFEKRREFYEKFKDKVMFGKIIHSSCWIDPTSTINSGSVIYPNSTIDANVTIGNNVLVNLSVVVSHDSIIGSHSFIAPSVAIAGFVNIGNSCFIGVNSTVLDSLEIASCTVIGGGTLVIKTIEESGTYIGLPAKKIK